MSASPIDPDDRFDLQTVATAGDRNGDIALVPIRAAARLCIRPEAGADIGPRDSPARDDKPLSVAVPAARLDAWGEARARTNRLSPLSVWGSTSEHPAARPRVPPLLATRRLSRGVR